MHDDKAIRAGVKVVARGGSTSNGTLTGARRRCQLEGCLGVRLYVRWNDGKLTLPCTKGMTYDDLTNTWEIR